MTAPPEAEAPLLRVAGLSKSFAGVVAVASVSFEVRQHAITALIGPNGAGKTTLFNLLTNVYPPDGGEARFDGRTLAGKSPNEIAQLGMIRTFQTARVFPQMTVLSNILLGGHRLGHVSIWEQALRLPRAARAEHALLAQAEELLDVLGLARQRDLQATGLPLGEQKLLELGRALLARPRLLLLDEPAAGLNESEVARLRQVLSAVRASGITILLVEHNMALVMKVGDHVVVMDQGAIIAAGTPAAVQQDERVIGAYLGQKGPA